MTDKTTPENGAAKTRAEAQPVRGGSSAATQTGAKTGTELIPNRSPRKAAANKGLAKTGGRIDIPRRPTEQTKQSSTGQAARTYPESRGKQLIVGQDISLSGEIKDCESLVVEGSVEAALIGSDSLIITQNGRFKGPAEVTEADITGEFHGELTVHGRLTVRYGGRVLGQVRYGELMVEIGGEIVGSLEALNS